MSRLFAQIHNGIVFNTIVADSWDGAVDITDLDPRPGKGWSYNGQSFAPPASVPQPEIPLTPLMTHFAFLSRLTLDEHVAIEEAMPTSTILRVAKQRFDAAREVDVSLIETQQFIGLVAQMGLILPERVAQILALKLLSERGAINPQTGLATS